MQAAVVEESPDADDCSLVSNRLSASDDERGQEISLSTDILHSLRHTPSPKNLSYESELNRLLMAIERGNMAHLDPYSVSVRLRFLEESGGTVDSRSKRGEFPLYVACAYGHYDVAHWLIQQRADINNADRFGITALMEVAKRGCTCLHGMHCRQLGDKTLRCRTEICRLLLDEKADVSMRMRALVVTDSAIPMRRIREPAKKRPRGRITRTTSGGLTTIHDDIVYDGTTVVGYVKGTTAFMRAVQYGNFAMAELMLRNRADVNATDELGTTPLMLAAGNGCRNLLQLLVKHKAYLCNHRCIGDCDQVWHRGIYNCQQISSGSLARAKGYIDAFKYLHKHGVK